MLSGTLVQFVEDHCEAITDRIIRQVQQDPRLPHIGSLPQSELRERARDIVKHLGNWLMAEDRELATQFKQIGAQRFKDCIPLSEVVLSYEIVKAETIESLRDRGLGHSAVLLYAEEELEHMAGRFFDRVLYHMVEGYEEALHQAGLLHELTYPKSEGRHAAEKRRAPVKGRNYKSFGGE